MELPLKLTRITEDKQFIRSFLIFITICALFLNTILLLDVEGWYFGISAVYTILYTVLCFVTEKKKFPIVVMFLYITNVLIFFMYGSIYYEGNSFMLFHFLAIIFSTPWVYTITKSIKHPFFIVVFTIAMYTLSFYSPNFFPYQNKESGRFFLNFNLAIGVACCLMQLILYMIFFKSFSKRGLVSRDFISSFEYEKNEDYAESFSALKKVAQENEIEFYNVFYEAHPNFDRKLLEVSPDLSLTEIRTCYYLALDFTTKEISEFTYTSVKGIESRKFRIRKKLIIDDETELIHFLKSLIG